MRLSKIYSVYIRIIIIVVFCIINSHFLGIKIDEDDDMCVLLPFYVFLCIVGKCLYKKTIWDGRLSGTIPQDTINDTISASKHV